MSNVLPTGHITWTAPVVDATHAAPISIEILAAPLNADGSEPPITSMTVRATLPATATSVALADLSPPLALGGECIVVMALNSGGSADSTAVPFTLVDLPPNPPENVAVS